MCWNITGSPPPAALKNEVAKNLSVSSIVTAPASTGITAISRKAVISQVQQKIGIFSRSMPGARMLRMVAMTLIAPMIELMPIMWMAKIAKATLLPPCSESGGYSVQPPAGAPPGRNSVSSSIAKANGRIQKRPVVHARQRHVRRADLQRDHPVGQADEGRHHAAEDHDQRVHGGHLVEEHRVRRTAGPASSAPHGSPPTWRRR